ncbi:MAG TPA: hypothetical protein VHW23_33380 [Kofleriaceae bacterium]|nr:hypothetical protein [Kofleriaceae bacterium]
MTGRRAAVLIAFTALGVLDCARENGPSAPSTGTKIMAERPTPPTATDLLDAIELAEHSFGQANASTADYQLVFARRLLAGSEHCSGTRCWQLTFKQSGLIPTSATARIGAGGELFFVVDVEHRQAKFTGHGE